ncbi:hypothetical protein WJ438_33715 [Streptomyces sp. GD-15H]|uniref:hypothetical protein n=1 Tax=Streptomyces sp. GD-15H TaxID=3129112 RepID=UPI003243B3F8
MVTARRRTYHGQARNELDDLQGVDRLVGLIPDAVHRVRDGVLVFVFVTVSVSVVGPQGRRFCHGDRLFHSHDGERLVKADEARPVQGAQQVGRHQEDQSDEQHGWRGPTLGAAAGHRTHHAHTVMDSLRTITA